MSQISAESGQRSDPFIGDWSKIATSLQKLEEQQRQDYLLLVALLDPEDEDQMVIPNTPLLKIESFIEMYKNRENQTA